MKRVCIMAISLYQRAGRALGVPSSCRYAPTCSEYVKEAIRRHGMIRGLWLGAGRIGRCHPFARGGIDPVEK